MNAIAPLMSVFLSCIPIIAAVKGRAIGGAAVLCTWCDSIVASQSA